jgi:hypothetical protein
MMMKLQEETIKTLTSIYGKNSSFWELWESRKNEYFEAVQIEKRLELDQLISFETYADLADKKSSFGKIAIDSLWVLSNQKNEETYQSLLESHKYFSIGFQLCDDVKDFKEDLEKEQFNWGIYLLQDQLNFDEYGDNYETLNKLFFLRGVGQELLVKAIENFDSALDILQTLEVDSEWKETIRETWKAAITDLDITNHYIKSLEKRVELMKEPKNDKQFFKYTAVQDATINKGLSYIKSEYASNYVDLKHLMYLGKIDGFENTEQVHVSDTFQRSLLNDCLITVVNKYNLDGSEFLNNECDYLIAQCNRDEIGAWGYFPTVKEIAADIDDLGQMMQLFVNSNKIEYIEKYCEKGIGVALKDRVHNDGGIETWIIPKENQTDVHKKQEHFNLTRWGAGPDLEVVANFVYALELYDSHKHKEQVSKSLQYIVSSQNIEGYWESVWYFGHFYGTYVCLRLFKIFGNQFSDVVSKAIDYIKKEQNDDGGFSLEEELPSDPLSTSFALLALKTSPNNCQHAIRQTESFLTSCQNGDGSWEAVDFIKPKFLEPYRSKVMTTGYVLKALSSDG